MFSQTENCYKIPILQRIKSASICVVLFLLFTNPLHAENFPDQFYILRGDSIFIQSETISGITLSSNGKNIQLEDSLTTGYLILKPVEAQYPFNRGLPSWNGTAPEINSGFVIQMRFPYGNNWSPWLTVGFWKEYFGGSYGTTSYGGGEVDIDYIKLYSYQNSWQFKIFMYRTSVQEPSPTLHKLSFFISDTRTTDDVDIDQIVLDNPVEIYIPTEFFWQYAVDSQFGGLICSPTSVAMILRSYDIEVDARQFALDTYDSYYGIFGVWPRVVQNASEYGLDGAVTRYRSWSQAREVLADGGRIAMAVGLPLYSGHLMMLAGFNASGNPIVHDPAKSTGYGYIFNKRELSRSWFEKGGIAYTFYLADSLQTYVSLLQTGLPQPNDYQLFQNYPNPFNPVTNISFFVPEPSHVTISIYDVGGRIIDTIYHRAVQEGRHTLTWEATDLPSGVYYIALASNNYRQVIKSILLK